MIFLEGGAADSLNLVFLLGGGQEESDGQLMGTGGAVAQLRHGDVVAISDFEIVLLDTNHEDEGIGVDDAVAVPCADQEGTPVKIHAIVEVIEPSLILVDEVGGDNGLAKTQRRLAAALLGEVDEAAGIGGEAHRDGVLAI